MKSIDLVLLSSLGFLITFVIFTNGSELKFEASPGVIQSSLTPSLTLTCDLTDGAQAGLPQPTGMVGRSVTSSDQTFAYVTSVVILRDGQDVASITPFTPATALLDKSSLNVTGVITAGAGAHLSLTWTLPGAAQGGNYKCEVNGIVGAGHNEVLTKSLVVSVEAASLSQLTSHIHEQEVKLQSQDVLIHSLQQQLVDQQQKYTNLEEKMSNQTDVKLQQVMSLISQQQQHQHTENGTVMCGLDDDMWYVNHHVSDPFPAGQGAWTDVDRQWTVATIQHTFNTNYTSPPVIRWTVTDIKHLTSGSGSHTLWDHARDLNTEYHINVVETDINGFTIQCKIPNTSRSRTHDTYAIKLHWTSFSTQ